MRNKMIGDAIKRLVERRHLTTEESEDVMSEIMSGEASDVQIAGFLTAMRMKGETDGEILGFARTMRRKALKIEPAKRGLIDTCGTGGDGSGTFNISTAAAFVLSAAGARVAKHGNRSVSSRCGSADVLEALGVRIDLEPKAVESLIDEIGIGFLFAPIYHGAMKYAAKPRRELGVRTVFNLLGPLCNPAGAERQVLGVYSGGLTETMASVLLALGSERAMVVHGCDGLDEISVCGPTRISEVKDGKVASYVINPEDFGLRRAGRADIRGGCAEENAKIILDVLKGGRGPARDVVLLNAGAGIMVAGLAESLADGIRIAGETIDNGAAYGKLEELREMSNRLAKDTEATETK